MDKKLNELKKVFENEIPVSFSDHNRQSVLEKIHKKRNGHIDRLFPMSVTAIFLVLFIFIGGIIANDYFHSTNSPNESEINIGQVLIESRELLNQLDEVETSAASYDGKKEIKFRLMVEKKITEGEAAVLFTQILDSIIDYSNNKNIWNYYNGYFDINSYDEGVVYTATKLINEDLIVNSIQDNSNYKMTFDPEKVQVGHVLGDFKITDIQNHKGEILITFQGKNVLSGEINYYEKLEFFPDEWSLSKLPIADQHMEEEIDFYFQHSHMINKGGLTPKFPQNIKIDISGFQYLYSPILGSNINFEVREYFGVEYENEGEAETYETTIELSDELLEIYNQYEASLDDLLLNDLKPIDIFKLYHHAVQIDHQEVVYALFIQDGTYEIPDKETYLKDIASMDDKVMKENKNKYYEELMGVEEFNQMYRADDESVITYSTNSSEHDQFFQLVNDNRTNVWKVSWLPIQ